VDFGETIFVDVLTEVCTSKSDTLVTTLGLARQVYVFAYQETCQIGHRSRNTFLPGVSALSLLPVHTSVRSSGIKFLGAKLSTFRRDLFSESRSPDIFFERPSYPPHLPFNLVS
jgi:hypothetical protein